MGAPPPRECDFAVVGAGIVGLATARELARRNPGARIAVLEREDRIAAHQSSHSSGVIHAGIYYRPGSLKARLCVEGARRLYAYCGERGIEARKTGKLIIATEEQELPRLDELERRGKANRVPGLRRIGADEVSELEPYARGLEALHSPETGVVDFERVAAAFAEDLGGSDGSVHTGCEVDAVREGELGVLIEHRHGDTRAGLVVLCAGAWSDRLAVGAGATKDPRIVPFRGAYLRLRPERREMVRSLIYPVPDPDLPFLGAHLTRGFDDDVLLGPTALIAGARDAYELRRVRSRDLRETLAWPGTWRLARRFWRTGVTELRHALARRSLVAEVRRFVPALRPTDALAGWAGVRAQAVARDGSLIDDFVVSHTERTLHVRNAPSPAATSCLALAELIADRLDAKRDAAG